MSKKDKKKDKVKTYDIQSMRKAIERNSTVQLPEEYNKENMAVFGANINLKRHINEIRDGLKPVSRRLLLTMYWNHLYKGETKKCATIIGDVLGKYHQPTGGITW